MTTTALPGLTLTDCRTLAESWELSLRAARKSAATLKSYTDGLRLYLDYCEVNDLEPLRRANLNTWVAHLLDTGSAPATARVRQLAVRRFSSWLAEESEIDTDPFLGVKSPKLDERVVEPLTDDEIRAMLKACMPPKTAAPKQAMFHRRDEAIIRFMFETGTRAGETATLQLADVDVANGVAIVRRGKGGKGRRVPFGPQTALALDRYLRLRRAHRLADTPGLWLGDRGKGFSYDALHKTLALRAAQGGVSNFHPHKLRHTAAHRWLAAGGSESGLMAVAGWTRPDMLMRYTKAQASARAADEARNLNLGDI